MSLAETDTDQVVNGLLAFNKSVVDPLTEGLHDILENPRKHYELDGRYHPDLVATLRTVRREAATAGYYSMCVPAAIGGGGLGRLTFFKAWDALTSKYGPGENLPYFSVAHWATGPSAMWAVAGGRLAADILPRVLSADLVGCFGLSEPEAGSDAWGLKTTATRDGDSWRLNGSKQWTSNAPYADYMIVIAITDQEKAAARRGGVTGFYVPLESPGFKVESVIKLWGELGGNEGISALTDVVATPDQVFGEVGGGFKIAMYAVNQGRLYNTGRAVGLSTWALHRAVEYAKSRHTFGKPLHEHQAVQLMLADCATEIYTARAAGLRLARDNDDDSIDINRKDASIIKYHATNVGWRVFDRAIQIHGGMGVTNEVRLFEGLHTMRTLRIADGPDDILRTTIAKELVKGDMVM